jgi:hypothetical protein
VIHDGSGSRADSLIIDVDNLEKKLKKRNYLKNDVSVNLAGAGFRLLEDYYVHFNIALTTTTRVGYPGDLVGLKDGNWDVNTGEPRDIDLGGLGAHGSSYLQFAAGVSTEIMEGFYVGATLKYLKGAANLNTRKSDLMIETEGDPIRVNAEGQYRIRAAAPMSIQYDSSGFVSSVDFNNTFSDVIGDYILNKNHGGAIDLGVIYEYDENITLAASLVDLGLIRWASNVHQFEAEGNFDYIGFDLKTYDVSGDPTDFLQSLADSIVESLHFEAKSEPYTTALNPKLYLGGTYRVFPKVRASALLRTDFFDRRPHFSVTLAGMYSPFSFLHGTLSYSIMNYKFNHLGFGLAIGGPGAQFYVVSDHIPIRWVKDAETGAIWPYNARTANLRFGVNIIFGCRDRDRDRSGKRRPGSRGRGKYCPAYD